MVVHASPSRAGGAVMDGIAPYYDKPPACDGYSGYGKFVTRQRCRAHVLRESGALARGHGKASPELAALHGSPVLLYHDAKIIRRGPGRGPAVDAGPMEAAAATAIAVRFGLHAAGGTSAAKLANAAPFLFTFANRPGVDPTNNESERMLRKVVMARRIRFRIASMGREGGGGGRQDVLKHNDLRADVKRKLGVSNMLLKVLSET